MNDFSKKDSKYKNEWIVRIESIFRDPNNKKENLMKTLEQYVNYGIIDDEYNLMKLSSIIYFKMIYDILEYEESEILGEKAFLDTFYSKIHNMLNKIRCK
jgi:hypothetical protein